MGSPFRSALAKLDDSVQNLEQQIMHLRGGVEIADDQLWQALDDTHQSSAALRDLIRAENPDAEWNDRRSLELLIQQLEWEAQAKRDEERRAKIFDLAGELDAGTIKHRFESRVAALNSLRLQAIRELRIAGTLFEQEKELPGPAAAEWIHWACNLQEETDGPFFESLRRDFPSLERFATEMEESYWAPGHREHDAASEHAPASIAEHQPSQPENPLPTVAAPENTVRSATPQPELRVPRNKPAPTTDFENAPNITSSDVPGPAVSTRPVLAVSIASQVQDGADEPANSNSPIVELPPRSTATAKTGAIEASTASEEAARPSTDHPEALAADRTTDDLLPSFGAMAAPKKPVAIWIAAGVIVLLGGVFVGTYYFSSGSGKSSESVAHAASKPADAVGSTTSGQPAAGAGSANAAIQPIEGAQHQILLNMESCRRSNAENIQCLGYVTNLGAEPSHVTLGGVDVVDGKGNSFNLNGNSQVNFSNGRSQNIAAGSRAQYTVTVPDKDRDARTVTVYVDVANPRGLEFTFRNIPIAE